MLMLAMLAPQDHYACDGCGLQTVKCSTCDVGMAVVGNASLEDPYNPASSTYTPDPMSCQKQCALCSGGLRDDEVLLSLRRSIDSCPSRLVVYDPLSDPQRRDLARLLASLFGPKLMVGPAAQMARPARWDPQHVLGLADDGFNGEAGEVPPQPAAVPVGDVEAFLPPEHVLFLPTPLARGVYAPHPRRRDCYILVTQFHSFIAREKAQEFAVLVQRLVRGALHTHTAHARVPGMIGVHTCGWSKVLLPQLCEVRGVCVCVCVCVCV
jgi:hypothetical protein